LALVATLACAGATARAQDTLKLAVGQHGNPNGHGHQLVQKTEPRGQELSKEKIDAGRIAAGPIKARDQAELDGVFGDAEDDRDRRGRRLGGARG
jgi:hypothetical protein